MPIFEMRAFSRLPKNLCSSGKVAVRSGASHSATHFPAVAKKLGEKVWCADDHLVAVVRGNRLGLEKRRRRLRAEGGCVIQPSRIAVPVRTGGCCRDTGELRYQSAVDEGPQRQIAASLDSYARKAHQTVSTHTGTLACPT